MSSHRFEGKVAVITGAASGIGAATARLMGKEGASLVLGDLNEAGLTSLAADFEGALISAGDVSRQSDVETLIKTATDKYGRVDILFNNAGVGSYGNSVEMDAAQWERVIAIDLHSVFYACKAAIPHMPSGSAIVNTASISGLGGDYRFAAYKAAKGAVINYTRALAMDHAGAGMAMGLSQAENGFAIAGVTAPTGATAAGSTS